MYHLVVMRPKHSILLVGLILLLFLFIDNARATTGTITVIKSGNGQGRVISSPDGINCGSVCSKAFVNNETIVLTAEPEAGSEFISWNNVCTSKSGNNCSVGLGADVSVEAVFNKLVDGVDLVITDVQIVDSLPSGGPVPVVGDIAISGNITVKNRGNVPAVFKPETRDVYVGTVNGLPTDPKADLIAGLSTGTGTLTIGSGESKVFDFNTTQDARHRAPGGYLGTEGEKILYFMIDRNNVVQEVNENNNIFTKKIIVMGTDQSKIYFSLMGNSHPQQIVRPGQKNVRFLEFFMGNGVGEVTVSGFVVGLLGSQDNKNIDFVKNVRLVDSNTGDQLGPILPRLKLGETGVYGEVDLYKSIVAVPSTQKTISIMADIGTGAVGANSLGLINVKFKRLKPEVISLPVYNGSVVASQFSMLCDNKETVKEKALKRNEFALLRLDTTSYPEILRYRIKLSKNKWSRWYVVGKDDIDRIKNKDGSKRRMWSYFATSEHEIERCKIPNGPKPDLVVKNFKASHLNGWSLDTMIEYDVGNVGTEKIDRNFWITIKNLTTGLILRDYELSGDYFTPNNLLHHKWAGKVGWGLIKGNNKIEVTIDSYNNIYESNEGNNRLVQVVNSEGL